MFGRCLAILSLFALVQATMLPAPVLADEAGCNVDKLSALSQGVASLMRCRARTVAKADPPDPDCIAQVESRLAADFAEAQADPACASTGEISDVTSALRAFDDELITMLVISPAGSRCASGKVRTTSRRTRRELSCRRSAAADAVAVDPLCISAAQDKLATVFARREAGGNCETSGDAAAVGELVTDFLSFSSSRIDGSLLPPVPTGLAAVVNVASIDLTWTAPDPGSGLTVARVLRSLNAPPAGPDDAGSQLVFEGEAEAAVDALTALLPNTSGTPRVYHYAVYACDTVSNCETTGSHTTLTPTVRQVLVAGGYVLHWRHASADVCSDNQSLGTAATTMYPDWWKSCDNNCGTTATARQLNATGVAESIAIGDAFATLGITVGRVLTSEYCRNFTTAALMDFGPVVEQSQELTYWVYDEASRCSDTFVMLGEAPAPGTNTALIGHAGNTCPPLSTLAWAEAAIYKPDGMGSATYIDRVLQSGWLSLP
jgi:phosphohistidine phosphatase SixA